MNLKNPLTCWLISELQLSYNPVTSEFIPVVIHIDADEEGEYVLPLKLSVP